MLHPSYTDLMKKVNSNVEEGETPVVNSRYSIVMATAKRARQIIAGETAASPEERKKPLSTAVTELDDGKITILPDLPEDEQDDTIRAILRDEAALLGETVEEFTGTANEEEEGSGEDAGEDASSGEEENYEG